MTDAGTGCSNEVARVRAERADPATEVSDIEINAEEQKALTRLSLLGEISGRGPSTGCRVLEIGCGIGSFLALLRGLGWDVSGVEPDADYAETGRQLYGLTIDAQPIDMEATDEGPFDLIVMSMSKELCLPGNPRVFEMVRQRLGADGVFVLELVATWRSVLTDRERVLRPNEAVAAGFMIERTACSGTRFWVVLRKRRESDASEGGGNLSLTIARALPHIARANLARGRRVAGRAVRAVRQHPMLIAAKKPLAHFGVQRPVNAGDVVLSDSVRATVGQVVGRPWILEEVRKVVRPAQIERINRHTAGLVVGGGGLFLGDTNRNVISGWQWPISADLISRIEVPLAVFAVGYNQFRGQGRLSDVFAESLHALVENSVFVGIRNNGSIRELSTYLPQHLRPRLSFQPCPTTVLSYLPRGESAIRHAHLLPVRPPVLAVNVAFDRFGRRFGARLPAVLSGIARMALLAQQEGWQIVVTCHSRQDAALSPYLNREGVSHLIKDLSDSTPDDTLAFYASVSLVAGMRGHAQLIPFGLGVPIISLIAHDKLAWFLEDIGYPEWGADVSHDSFPDDLVGIYSSIASDLPGHRASIVEARQRLWAITQNNLRQIREIFVP